METIESEIRQLETEGFSSKIDELNKGLKPVETPSWKLMDQSPCAQPLICTLALQSELFDISPTEVLALLPSLGAR